MLENKLSEEERLKVFNDNNKLVYHILKNYKNKLFFIDEDDLVQYGMIGLWRGCLTINIDSGNKPSSYLGRCIENEYLALIRDNYNSDKQKVHNPYMCNQFALDDTIDGTVKYEDVIADDSLDDERDMVKKASISYYISVINEIVKTSHYSDRNKKIFYDVSNGKSMKEVADSYGVTKQAINMIYSRLLRHVRRKCRELNIDKWNS